jgi:hypothetical protein
VTLLMEYAETVKDGILDMMHCFVVRVLSLTK